jgi:hypothetical protein
MIISTAKILFLYKRKSICEIDIHLCNRTISNKIALPFLMTTQVVNFSILFNLTGLHIFVERVSTSVRDESAQFSRFFRSIQIAGRHLDPHWPRGTSTDRRDGTLTSKRRRNSASSWRYHTGTCFLIFTESLKIDSIHLKLFRPNLYINFKMCNFTSECLVKH